MQHHGNAVELGLDLVFNISLRYEHSTEVAGSTTSLPTPHPYGNRAV
jgi:hypothetical protein